MEHFLDFLDGESTPLSPNQSKNSLTADTVVQMYEEIQARKKAEFIYDENGLSECIYKTQYIDGDALDLFTTFTQHEYLTKSNCGAGGTTGVLKANKIKIICTPNRSQVINKQTQQETYLPTKCYFIYGGSNGKSDRWEDVYEAIKSGETDVTIMTVVDSLFLLKDMHGIYSEIYEFLKDYDILIDEAHTILKDDFRPIMKILDTEIATWRGVVKYSTATPHPMHLEVQPKLKARIVKMTSINKKNQIVHYSENKDDYLNFVETQLNFGRNVIVFSNNVEVYKKLIGLYEGNGGNCLSNIINISVGQSLRLKINKWERERAVSHERFGGDADADDYSEVKTLEADLKKPHKRLFLCSSANFAGWDFTKSCSMVIISDQRYVNYNFDWQDMIQAFGRARNEVHDILYVNIRPKVNPTGVKQCNGSGEWELYEPVITKEKLDAKLQYIPNDGVYENRVSISKLQNQHITLNPDEIKKKLAEYGYYLEQYEPNNLINKPIAPTYSSEIMSLMTYGIDYVMNVIKVIAKHQLHRVRRIDNLKVKTGMISEKLTMSYYIAYVLLKYQPKVLLDRLNDTKLKQTVFAGEVRNFMLNFMDRNHHNIDFDNSITDYQLADKSIFPDEYEVYEFVMLYTGCGYDEKTYSDEVKRQIRISVVMGDLDMLVDQILSKNRVTVVVNRMITRLKVLNTKKYPDDEKGFISIELNKTEMEYLRLSVIRNFKDLEKWFYTNAKIDANNKLNGTNVELKPLPKYKTRETILNQIKRAALFFYTNGQGTYEASHKKYRLYSALTNLQRNLRIALPIKFSGFDIKSANPTIIGMILGIDIKKYTCTYEEFARKKSISDLEGKSNLNGVFNNHRLTHDEAKWNYSKWGLTNTDATRLSLMTAQVPVGSFHIRMTTVEEDIINEFVQAATNKYPMKLYNHYFTRFHDASIIPNFLLGDCELETTFQKGRVIFEKSEFNSIADLRSF